MNCKYSDRQYDDWYEKYLEQFDYEESKVAVERLGVSQQIFCRPFWVLCISVLLFICLLGAWTWRYFDCTWGDCWADCVCGLFQNASMGLLTGLILMLYTNKRDQSLAHSKEMLRMLELREKKFLEAFNDLSQIPFSDEEEREGVVRNQYILHCLVNLSWHIVDFHEQLFSRVKSKKMLLFRNKKEHAKLVELLQSIGNSGHLTPRKRLLQGYCLVQRSINRMVGCIEKLRMDIFELQYARKAIRESSSLNKIKELQEKKMRKVKKCKGKDR